MNNVQTVSVLGLGYIGLPTAAILANAGFNVLGVDIRTDIVEVINSGDIHISEEGLDTLVRAAVQKGNLHASTSPHPADVHIIAVPTPTRADKSPDLSYVEAATHTLSQVLKPGDLVIVESTIPPRACVDFIAPLIDSLTGFRHEHDYYLAHCPERVIPGKILHELVHNDRVIGGTTPEATNRAAIFYASFVQGSILKTSATTAEMCKLMENTFRDVNIALANEFANVAEDLGADIHEAIKLANHHPRVNIHQPGIGVGGHCIPIDPWFIVDAVPEKAKLIRMAREINDARPQWAAQRILEIVAQTPRKRVALLGLAYKPNVDDLRESPAVEVVKEVAMSLADPVYVVEPHIRSLPEPLKSLPNLHLVSTEEARTNAHLFFLLVNHQEFAPTENGSIFNSIDVLRAWKPNQKVLVQ